MGTAPEGFGFIAGFLAPVEQAALLHELRALDYNHDSFRGQKLKRGYAQFGYAYISAGRKVETAAAMPEFLRAVIDRIKPHCPPDTEFNQCIVTHYPAGSGIGWHTDKPVFGECVVGVSLCSEARLQLRPNGAEEASYEVRAVPGSMYLMHGAVRWEYEHQVLPVKRERFSLTFRHVSDGANGSG